MIDTRERQTGTVSLAGIVNIWNDLKQPTFDKFKLDSNTALKTKERVTLIVHTLELPFLLCTANSAYVSFTRATNDVTE